MVASFPGPRPASRCLQYGEVGEDCKRQKAEEGPGNEARVVEGSWEGIAGCVVHVAVHGVCMLWADAM